jgi:hypothetical protein
MRKRIHTAAEGFAINRDGGFVALELPGGGTSLMYFMLGHVVIGVSDPAAAPAPSQLQRPSALKEVSNSPAATASAQLQLLREPYPTSPADIKNRGLFLESGSSESLEKTESMPGHVVIGVSEPAIAPAPLQLPKKQYPLSPVETNQGPKKLYPLSPVETKQGPKAPRALRALSRGSLAETLDDSPSLPLDQEFDGRQCALSSTYFGDGTVSGMEQGGWEKMDLCWNN